MITGQPAFVGQRIYEFEPVAATLVGDLLCSDQIYYRHAGPRRYFWLLSENVQLIYEPFGWTDEWYVDVVSIERKDGPRGPEFRVVDRYIDIVVEGNGPTYRMIDLDQAGAALASGVLGADAMCESLAWTQAFCDRHLHRHAPFPPAAVRDFFSANHHYPDWSVNPVRLRAERPA
jgi:predicted RNA-binding protein associated with RNAse of E/G family